MATKVRVEFDDGSTPEGLKRIGDAARKTGKDLDEASWRMKKTSDTTKDGGASLESFASKASKVGGAFLTFEVAKKAIGAVAYAVNELAERGSQQFVELRNQVVKFKEEAVSAFERPNLSIVMRQISDGVNLVTDSFYFAYGAVDKMAGGVTKLTGFLDALVVSGVAFVLGKEELNQWANAFWGVAFDNFERGTKAEQDWREQQRLSIQMIKAKSDVERLVRETRKAQSEQNVLDAAREKKSIEELNKIEKDSIEQAKRDAFEAREKHKDSKEAAEAEKAVLESLKGKLQAIDQSRKEIAAKEKQEHEERTKRYKELVQGEQDRATKAATGKELDNITDLKAIATVRDQILASAKQLNDADKMTEEEARRIKSRLDAVSAQEDKIKQAIEARGKAYKDFVGAEVERVAKNEEETAAKNLRTLDDIKTKRREILAEAKALAAQDQFDEEQQKKTKAAYEAVNEAESRLKDNEKERLRDRQNQEREVLETMKKSKVFDAERIKDVEREVKRLGKLRTDTVEMEKEAEQDRHRKRMDNLDKEKEKQTAFMDAVKSSKLFSNAGMFSGAGFLNQSVPVASSYGGDGASAQAPQSVGGDMYGVDESGRPVRRHKQRPTFGFVQFSAAANLLGGNPEFEQAQSAMRDRNYLMQRFGGDNDFQMALAAKVDPDKVRKRIIENRAKDTELQGVMAGLSDKEIDREMRRSRRQARANLDSGKVTPEEEARAFKDEANVVIDSLKGFKGITNDNIASLKELNSQFSRTIEATIAMQQVFNALAGRSAPSGGFNRAAAQAAGRGPQG